MREKEKKIGSSFINLANYADLESTNIGQDIRVTSLIPHHHVP